MSLYHLTIAEFQVGEHLVGMKAAHKRLQRMGQKRVDEDFERIRKRSFPNAPSLFTSLWVTNGFDPSIPRKMFQENPSIAVSFLYEVEPIGGVYQVEPQWEVLACRAVTQSGLAGQALQQHIDDIAQRFWEPELVDTTVGYFLCEKGAVIKSLVRQVARDEVAPNALRLAHKSSDQTRRNKSG